MKTETIHNMLPDSTKAARFAHKTLIASARCTLSETTESSMFKLRVTQHRTCQSKPYVATCPPTSERLSLVVSCRGVYHVSQLGHNFVGLLPLHTCSTVTFLSQFDLTRIQDAWHAWVALQRTRPKRLMPNAGSELAQNGSPA